VIIDHQNNEYPAELVAKDDKSDIAVLESSAYNAPVLPEGNTTLSIGDGVFAIGSPFSLGHSVSLGIISGLKRFVPNYPYVSFIQTDAAINPGNSGGALFNLKGELIGMVSNYFSKQGNYTNIAFAIGIDDVHRISQRHLNEKKIVRGYLGAELLISERVSRKLGYQCSVLLTRIEPNSPAEIGGLKAGDIIIGLDNKVIEDGGEFHRQLERSYPDQNISFTLIRNKQRQSISVTLGTTPLQKKEITNVSTGDASEKLGLILNENSMGIEVLTSYSIAKTAGFSPADEILAINRISVNTIQEFNTQLKKLKENEIALLTVRRNGIVLTLPLGSKTAIKGYSTKN